jgi:fibronectin-binding autotransporter adhesin
LANSEAIGHLIGSGQVSLGSSTLTLEGSGTLYNGVISGTGGVTVALNANATINGAQLYDGLTAIDSGGSLRLNGSLAGGLTVNAGGLFSGNATVAGTVTNHGHISPGTSPGTNIYLGDYIAGGVAVFDTEVEFNNAGAPVNGTTHDFVSIAGNVTGSTFLSVIPFTPSGSPAATTGNGIELVRVGGTVSASQFVLSAPVVQGGYQYLLRFVPTAGADSFYLQSVARDEAFAHAALISAGKTMTSACFLSAGAGSAADRTAGARSNGAWAKYIGGSRDTGADTGIETSQSFSCGVGGVDMATSESMRVGLSGGYGNSTVDVTLPTAIGTLKGDAGAIEAYAVFTRANLFVALAAGYGMTDWTFDTPSTTSLSATANGVIGSAQIGLRWPMGLWQIGVGGEIDYNDASCASDCLVAGSGEDISPWLGKISLRLDGALSGGTLLPYAAISYSDDFGGDNVSFGSATVIETETHSSLFGAQAGVTVLVDDNLAIFAHAGLTEGLSNDVSGFDGGGGLKLYW